MGRVLGTARKDCKDCPNKDCQCGKCMGVDAVRFGCTPSDCGYDANSDCVYRTIKEVQGD